MFMRGEYGGHISSHDYGETNKSLIPWRQRCCRGKHLHSGCDANIFCHPESLKCCSGFSHSERNVFFSSPPWIPWIQQKSCCFRKHPWIPLSKCEFFLSDLATCSLAYRLLGFLRTSKGDFLMFSNEQCLSENTSTWHGGDRSSSCRNLPSLFPPG